MPFLSLNGKEEDLKRYAKQNRGQYEYEGDTCHETTLDDEEILNENERKRQVRRRKYAIQIEKEL